jgi:hypothetical protein
MKQEITNHYDTWGRITKFGQAHAADFSPTSLGGKNFAAIATAVAEARQHGTAQQTGAADAHSATSNLALLLHHIYDDMGVINQNAHTLSLDLPGLDAKFRMPRSHGQVSILTTARAFAQEALPLKAKFIELGMSADFLDHLNGEIAAADAAKGDQQGAQGGRGQATGALDATFTAALKAEKLLNTIVRNIYAKTPAVLAEWLIASHVERISHHAKPAPAPAKP